MCVRWKPQVPPTDPVWGYHPDRPLLSVRIVSPGREAAWIYKIRGQGKHWGKERNKPPGFGVGNWGAEARWGAERELFIAGHGVFCPLYCPSGDSGKERDEFPLSVARAFQDWLWDWAAWSRFGQITGTRVLWWGNVSLILPHHWRERSLWGIKGSCPKDFTGEQQRLKSNPIFSWSKLSRHSLWFLNEGI